MRVLLALCVVLILGSVGMPLLGVLAGWPYQLLNAVGEVVAPDYFDAAQRAFRVGLWVGGAVSVLSLLRVAVQDLSAAYMGAAVGVALALFGVGVLSTPSRPHDSQVEMAAPRNEVAERPAPDPEQTVERMARAAARGRHDEVDAARPLLAQIAAAQTDRRNRREHEAARIQYEATRADGDHPVAVTAGRQAPENKVAADPVSAERLEAMGQAQLRELGAALMLARRTGMADTVATDSSAWSPASVLRQVRSLTAQALAHQPERVALWAIYAAVWADDDAERAFGALRLAAVADQADGTETIDGMWEIMEPLPYTTRVRWEILAARAQLQPDGQGPAQRQALARRVLPRSQVLSSGEGLALDAETIAAPAPPIIVDQDVEVRVEVDAVSRVTVRTLPAPQFPRASPPGNHVVALMLDVGEDGHVEETFVSHGSGHAQIDDRVRDTARMRWRFADDDTVPARVAVSVHVRIPETGAVALEAPGSSTHLGAAGLLETMLMETVRARPPRYPQQAALLGLEGTVTLEIAIAGSGQIRRVEVIESSGHGILDDSALRAARGWQVRPGEATEAVEEIRVRVPVTFRVP